MNSPKSIKDVQHLAKRVTALNRFISKVIDKRLPFFKALQKGKLFRWTKECKHDFQQLKVSYLGVDSLAYLASALTHSKMILFELLVESSINKVKVVVCLVNMAPTWMDSIIMYLRDGDLPDDKLEATI